MHLQSSDIIRGTTLNVENGRASFSLCDWPHLAQDEGGQARETRDPAHRTPPDSTGGHVACISDPHDFERERRPWGLGGTQAWGAWETELGESGVTFSCSTESSRNLGTPIAWRSGAKLRDEGASERGDLIACGSIVSNVARKGLRSCAQTRR